MARIMMGMALPHAAMLGEPGSTWLEFGDKIDRHRPGLVYRDKVWDYAALEAERRGQGIEAFLTLDERNSRSARCVQALDALRRVYAENKPDIAVVIGKDQKEMFLETSPSLAIYGGETIENGPPNRSVFAPDTPVTYPGCPDLAMHLIRSLQSDGFDMTEIIKWPPNSWVQQQPIVPHAYSFVYHQIMRDKPPPSVPVFMNTFYPPNQPSIGRSIELGKSLFKAIQSWDSDKTVGLFASGGLSHFVCDEEVDRRFLGYIKNFDFDGLASVDERTYQSGTSEVKMFAAILAALAGLGFETNIVDYVPCYRTPAGTGEGMAFAYWTPH